jgi:L-lactate dehydrogenase
VGGVPITDAMVQCGLKQDDIRSSIEKEVRFANITIIEGIGTSQYGIGMVCARIAEIVLRDERAVVPIGAYNSRYDLTLPTIVGGKGCVKILDPPLSDDEQIGLKKSIEALLGAQDRLR